MALTRLLKRPRTVLLAVTVLSWSAVGLALLSQYRFDMPPCPWCTLQRLIFLVIGALSLLAALLSPLRKPLSALAVLLSLSGVAAALWQHFVAAASNSCNLTLADRILESLGLLELAPAVFMPMASCADAAVDLLGVPYAFWSLALFALTGLLGLSALRR